MTDNAESRLDYFAREREIRAAFSPTAPIARRDLFSGRAHQLLEILASVDETGQHVVLFGERGVGKTSISSVAAEMLGPTASTVRVTCNSKDTFSGLWSRAFRSIVLHLRTQGVGFASQNHLTDLSVQQALDLPDELEIDDVRLGLEYGSAELPSVVFFDEFDRVEDSVHRDFADCLKSLSDHHLPATVVLIGVADDVHELVSEHASIERGLTQINMPRMSEGELSDIITRGLNTVGMQADPAASRRITQLSQGLPHYTHLLAQQAALNAFYNESPILVAANVDAAVDVALKRTQESVAQSYYSATYSAKQNLYKQVLLACANAHADDRGYFSASNVRESLSEILGRRVDIPQFAMHLNAFSSDRGPVLRKEGAQRNFRYRFVNPLLQPYVIMRGLRDELLAPHMLRR